MSADLHCHSTASDGTDAPGDLGRLAAEAGLNALALTDHDTTAGLAEAERGCDEAGVRFIPGIELSVERGAERGTMHVLGYFIDPAHEALQQTVRRVIEAREQRNPRMVEALRAMGVEISMADAERQAEGQVIGRPHFARVLVRKGYAKSIQQAFERYIGAGRPGYVRKDLLSPEEAIVAIHAAGGLAVLAHPVQLRCETDEELEATVRRLADAGLDGIEAWHSDHGQDDAERYRSLADRLGLEVTGGSDYHGDRKDITLGSVTIDDDRLARLERARGRQA